MSLKSIILKNLILLPGWKTKRKIVVIESDDWGTVRIPDAGVYKILSKKNTALEHDRMSKFDALENNDDLLALFDVLSAVKDSKGNGAVLTANTIMANPDFDKIAASDYKEYHYETFIETLNRYPANDKVRQLIAEGMALGLYRPQFHGREHVNINQWLKALQNGNTDLREAFQHKVFAIPFKAANKKRRNVVSAFDFDHYSEIEMQREILIDGMKLFKDIFGFTSSSFIATTYVWNAAIEVTLQQQGVKYIQGIPYQYVPNPGGSWYKKKFHYTGQKNQHGQVYLVRNAFFEPSLIKGEHASAECMQRIDLAFKWGKPAIISAHRVNFIGAIVEENRTKNLAEFKKLLQDIVVKWPDVEFMSSDQLGDLIQ